MSKRGRRRSSKRRKSSSSSKHSSSAYLFQKQCNSTTVSNRKGTAEKHEENFLQKENVLSGCEDQQYAITPPNQKRSKQDFNMAAFEEQQNNYTKTTEVEDEGVKIVTSESRNDMEKSSQNVQIQHSHEPSSENPTSSSTPITNIFNINCSGSHVKVEIQEIRQGNPFGIKTTCVFTNENESSENIVEGTKIADDQPLKQQPKNETSDNGSQEINYRFTFGSMNEKTKDLRSACPPSVSGDPSYCRCCSDRMQQNLARHSLGPPLLLDINPQGKAANGKAAKGKTDVFHQDQFCYRSTSRVFEDITYNTLEDLTNNLATIRTGGPSESESTFSVLEKERVYITRSFDQLSESDTYNPMFIRPSMSTNRSSFIKDFIYCQKRKSWIRNNSIATVEHKECLFFKKRRQTFPGMSLGSDRMHEDVLMPSKESISSFVTCSLPFQTERLEKSKEIEDMFSTCVKKKTISSQSRESSKSCTDSSETHGELTGIGLHKEMSPELYVEEIIQRGLAIQVIPPSCCGSEEQILQMDPTELVKDKDEKSFTHSDPALPEHSQAPAFPLSIDSLQHNFQCMSTSEEMDRNSLKDNNVAKEIDSNPTEQSVRSPPLLLMNEELDSQKVPNERCSEAADGLLSAVKPSPEIVSSTRALHPKVSKAEKPNVYRSYSEAKEHLKPGTHKEREGTDHWARKRKLFKESKQWSSTGGSSITSDITEESVSEDTLSTNVTVQDDEDRGFYAETFHSSAWIYQGDDIGSETIGPNLTVRTPAVSIRERTVQISKGTGEYPWGFRIQFSKPIVVTEVDTNGAAEEAGLIVGDYVLAVNGVDVTSIPHSEAANLARQGPDILTLTIGSDIARGPNTPRPPCRGYLHKRTQSGLIKGWRKRWFVLTHDCCLYYYKNKRDEGKRQPLSSIKLEGAEVGPADSLGKPFVFKCRPQSGSRVYFLYATSNQEMKRWCEALERAIHPITQKHVWVDVTRHNSNMPPLAVKNPDCLGLLNKMDKSKDTWIQHYCILKDACLYLYSGIRATHAHGGIYLQGYTVREQAYGSKKSTIELKPPSDEFKTFYFCADNSAENKRWILAIKASINKWRPFHQVLQDYMNLPPEETRM